jgi:hypothetical protein
VRRRQLLLVLSASALAPRKMLAQSKQPVLIGWLALSSRPHQEYQLTAFKQEIPQAFLVTADRVIE